MKRIVLKTVRLVNFKGIKNIEIDFSEKETRIMGANATGKTTIADAFTWLLFGKDTQGNCDTKFGIKTVDAKGKVIPKVDHEVTATLFVRNDGEIGETVELRRVYSEEWVTMRGSVEPALKGHSTSYFWNDVPLRGKRIQR
jgi:predicted ATP-dependent endonuclease of OLD family